MAELIAEGSSGVEHQPAGTLLGAPPAAASRAGDQTRWLLVWVGRVAEFGVVQVGVQVLAGVAGILVVRTLAKQEYALYAIANQMQAASNLLADLGIGIGLRAVGGRVWQDRRRFGELVTTALELRRWFALASLACCLPIAAWMLLGNGANWSATAILCGVIVAGVVPMLTSSVLLVVPQLHGEYRRIQKLDLGNAGLRLAIVAALAATRMTAALATAAGAVVNWMQLAWLRRWSREHADEAAPANDEDRGELVRLSVRQFPNTLFYCFQGQITLLILTLVGNSTGIADVTALGRLAILLTAFSAAFGNVLTPRFARCQDAERLPRLYVGLTGAAAGALVPVAIAGWVFPKPLLWILGESYEGLVDACGWVVMTACLTQLSTVMWMLNSSRAWIRFASWLWAPLTLATQFALACVLDLRDFNQLLKFMAATALVPFPILVADAMNGLARRGSTSLA